MSGEGGGGGGVSSSQPRPGDTSGSFSSSFPPGLGGQTLRIAAPCPLPPVGPCSLGAGCQSKQGARVQRVGMDPPWWGPGPEHGGSEGLAPVPAVPGLEVLLLGCSVAAGLALPSPSPMARRC